jgi:hypothetical protein
MYRISRAGQESPTDVGTVAEILNAIRSSEPGRYRIVEFPSDSMLLNRTARHWGVGVKNGDGLIKMEFAPWSS